ncbi:unnamed protein product, partial [Didymodactylos carnosus]
MFSAINMDKQIEFGRYQISGIGGSCLFRSILTIVNDGIYVITQEEIQNDRDYVAAIIQRNYGSDILIDGKNSRDKYCQKIKKDGYGSDIELQILAERYEIELIVIVLKNVQVEQIVCFGRNYGFKHYGYLLCNIIASHYDILRLTRTNNQYLSLTKFNKNGNSVQDLIDNFIQTIHLTGHIPTIQAASLHSIESTDIQTCYSNVDVALAYINENIDLSVVLPELTDTNMEFPTLFKNVTTDSSITISNNSSKNLVETTINLLLGFERFHIQSHIPESPSSLNTIDDCLQWFRSITKKQAEAGDNCSNEKDQLGIQLLNKLIQLYDYNSFNSNELMEIENDKSETAVTLTQIWDCWWKEKDVDLRIPSPDAIQPLMVAPTSEDEDQPRNWQHRRYANDLRHIDDTDEQAKQRAFQYIQTTKGNQDYPKLQIQESYKDLWICIKAATVDYKPHTNPLLPECALYNEKNKTIVIKNSDKIIYDINKNAIFYKVINAEKHEFALKFPTIVQDSYGNKKEVKEIIDMWKLKTGRLAYTLYARLNDNFKQCSYTFFSNPWQE